jgi:hypothetical protein
MENACSDYDDIIKAMSGRYFKTKGELAKLIHEVRGYKDRTLSTGYRLVNKLEICGLIKYVRNFGYVPVLDKEHEDLMLKTFSLISDLIEKGDVVLDENEKYYGRKLAREHVEILIEYALEHLLTRSSVVEEIVKEFNKLITDLNMVYRELRLASMDKRLELRSFVDEVVKIMDEIKSCLENPAKQQHLTNEPEVYRDIYELYIIGEVLIRLKVLYEKLGDFMGKNSTTIDKFFREFSDLDNSRKKLEEEVFKKIKELLRYITGFSLSKQLVAPGVCEHCAKLLKVDSEVLEELKSIVNTFKENLLYVWVKTVLPIYSTRSKLSPYSIPSNKS